VTTGIEQLAPGLRLTLFRGKAKRDTEDAGNQQDRIEGKQVDPNVDLGYKDLEDELPQRVGEPNDSGHTGEEPVALHE